MCDSLNRGALNRARCFPFKFQNQHLDSPQPLETEPHKRQTDDKHAILRIRPDGYFSIVLESFPNKWTFESSVIAFENNYICPPVFGSDIKHPSLDCA